MDDANRLKYSKCQWEKQKHYLLMIGSALRKTMIEGDEGSTRVFRTL